MDYNSVRVYNTDMGYEFSWSAFTIGFMILVAGVVLLRFYQPIADNLASGVASYERFKLAGLIACLLGLVVMLNLHDIILTSVLGPIFSR